VSFFCQYHTVGLSPIRSFSSKSKHEWNKHDILPATICYRLIRNLTHLLRVPFEPVFEKCIFELRRTQRSTVRTANCQHLTKRAVLPNTLFVVVMDTSMNLITAQISFLVSAHLGLSTFISCPLPKLVFSISSVSCLHQLAPSPHLASLASSC
jgi:hypothetical protein